MSFFGAVAQRAFNMLSNCNPDYTLWIIGSRSQWSPVRDFFLGIDVYWTQVVSGFKGTQT